MTSTIEPSTASAIASMVTGGNQAAAAAAALAAAAANPNSQESADYSQYWQYWSQYAAWNQYSNSSAQYEYEHVEQVEEDVSEYELIGKSTAFFVRIALGISALNVISESGSARPFL